MFALADIEVDSRAIRGYLEGDDDEERRGRASRRVMHTAWFDAREARIRELRAHGERIHAELAARRKTA